MKYMLHFLLWSQLLVPESFGQGYINFSNRAPEVDLDAPIYFYRPDIVVQLYGGEYTGNPVETQLLPLGDPIPVVFEDNHLGYWDTSGDVVREVSFAQTGQLAVFMIFAWDSKYGDSYEAVDSIISENVYTGRSILMTVPVGSVEAPGFLLDNPPNPGLRSFELNPTLPIPEPSTMVLLGCGGLLAAARWRRSIRRNQSS